METIIDKIITELRQRAGECYNHMAVHELNSMIKAVEDVEENASFEEIAALLMKHMGKNHHPHCTAIITSINGELLEGIKSTGETYEYIPD